MTQPTSLLTPGQVVERLAAAGIEVHEETVRAWTRQRKIPFVRLPGGRLFFRPEDIEAFIAPVEPPAVAS
jgi:excisionase family DNA binding protein